MTGQHRIVMARAAILTLVIQYGRIRDAAGAGQAAIDAGKDFADRLTAALDELEAAVREACER